MLLNCGAHTFLEMPVTSLVVDDSRFAVVLTPYLSLFSDSDFSEQILTLRVGNIVAVDTVRMLYDKQNKVWFSRYQVVSDDAKIGWTTGEGLEFFKYMRTAQNYSRVLQNRVFSKT